MNEKGVLYCNTPDKQHINTVKVNYQEILFWSLFSMMIMV